MWNSRRVHAGAAESKIYTTVRSPAGILMRFNSTSLRIEIHHFDIHVKTRAHQHGYLKTFLMLRGSQEFSLLMTGQMR